MTHTAPIVYVVDDDVSVRESLDLLIRCEGWQPEVFVSADEFLAHPRAVVPNCLVLDVSLPGLNGLELQKRIANERRDIPNLRTAYASLSPREREVMALVVSGFLNKQVGAELGISEITVKAHRGSLMKKMRAGSLPDLVNMATKLGLQGQSARAAFGTNPRLQT